MSLARGRKALLFAVISAAIWSAIGYALCGADWLEGTRLFWLDQLYAVRQRLGRAPQPHPDVLIVGIDERTRAEVRRRIREQTGRDVEDRWVIRHVIGRLLVELGKAKVKAVGVDFMLDRPLSKDVDDRLLAALGGSDERGPQGIDAVLGCLITVAEEKRPMEELRPWADEGNIMMQADRDGRSRRMRPGLVQVRPAGKDGGKVDIPLFSFRRMRPGVVQVRPAGKDGGKVDIPLFAFQVCRLFVGRPDEYGSARGTAWEWHDDVDASVEVPGHFLVPAEMLIDFAGPAQFFEMQGRQVSALDVLDQRVASEKLAGKLVLIGPALRNADRFSVPVAAGSAARDYREFLEGKYGVELGRFEEYGAKVDLLQGRYMSGIEIHANVVGQILHGRYLREASKEMPWLTPLVIAAVVLGLGWIFWQGAGGAKRRVLRGMVGSGILFLAVFYGAVIASVWLFVQWRWVFVPLELLAAWTGQAVCGITFTGVQLRRQNQKIEQMFGSAVGQELLDYINAHPEILTRNERRVATVLFCDIRGFTPLTEKLDSDEVVELLRRHFETLWFPLADEGAWVDKYVGDLVMAAWNVLQPIEDHALRGVRAAVAMKVARAKLNEERIGRGAEPINMGVGLHTGELVGGNIGSKKRSNFTLLGDTVNLASRIEGEARGGEVLISEDTYRLVQDHVLAVPRASVAIRGKTGRYTLYEVLGLADGAVVPGKEAEAEAARAQP